VFVVKLFSLLFHRCVPTWSVWRRH